jgi:hypothetical protein
MAAFPRRGVETSGLPVIRQLRFNSYAVHSPTWLLVCLPTGHLARDGKAN